MQQSKGLLSDNLNFQGRLFHIKMQHDVSSHRNAGGSQRRVVEKSTLISKNTCLVCRNLRVSLRFPGLTDFYQYFFFSYLTRLAVLLSLLPATRPDSNRTHGGVFRLGLDGARPCMFSGNEIKRLFGFVKKEKIKRGKKNGKEGVHHLPPSGRGLVCNHR